MIESFIAAVRMEAFVGANEIVGCTDAEMQNVANHEAKLDFVLPDAYKAFLVFGGHKIGALLAGCYFDYSQCLKQFDRFDAKNVKSNNFVFLKSFSYQFLFFLDEKSNDPCVYILDAPDAEPYSAGMKFSEFLVDKTQNYIAARSTLPIALQKNIAFLKNELCVFCIDHTQHKDTRLFRRIGFFLEDIETIHQNFKSSETQAHAMFLESIELYAHIAQKTDWIDEAWKKRIQKIAVDFAALQD
jgi:hypothetical protein